MLPSMLRLATAVSVIVIGASAVILTDAEDASVKLQPPLRRRAVRPDVVGCYALFTARDARIDGTFYNASPRVRLDTVEHYLPAGNPTRRLMHALDTLGNPSHTTHGMRPSWSADSLTDTVHLSFSTGFSGAYFAFAMPRGFRDTIHGRAVEYWDFKKPTDRGAVYAVRTACP